MSLDFSPAEFTDKEKYDPVETQAIVFSLMYVDLCGINEHNWEEAYKRFNMWESCYGTFMKKHSDRGIEDYAITPELVRKYIGIRTNVATKSFTQFKNKLVGIIADEAKASLNRWKNKNMEVVK